jgi:NADH-quinone oxidoreductase subunit E
MLTADEQREIADEQRRYPDRRAACVEALKIMQRTRGWISDDSLRELAEHLGMTADELESVATFYNMIFRRPVGRHVIFLCDSVSCWIMGLEALRTQLREKLNVDFGETSRDDEYTLLPVACLGACDHAPALLFDGELHGDINAQKLDALIGQRG